MGIIIYYFLFNSPDIGAKKLIEGFDVATTGDRAIPIIYIKNGDVVKNEGSITGTGLPNPNSTPFNITTSNVTTREVKSIFKGIKINSDNPGALVKSTYDSIMTPSLDSSLLQTVAFKSARLPIPNIPGNITFNLVLSGGSLVEQGVRTGGITLNKKPNVESAMNEIFSTGGTFSDDNSIVYSDIDDDTFSDISTGYILIFHFSDDQSGTNKLFNRVQMHLSMPKTGINMLGDTPLPLIGPITDDGASSTYISTDRADEIFTSGNNNYIINKSMSNLGDLIEPFRLVSQVDRFTTAEQNSLDGRAGITDSYNIDIDFINLIRNTDDDNILLANTLIAYKDVDTPLTDAENILLTETPDGYTSDDGVVTKNEGNASDPDEALNMDLRNAYYYVASTEIDIFKYVYLYYQAALQDSREDPSAVSDPDAAAAAKTNNMLNSIFLDMRIYNVSDDGSFGSQRGCSGGSGNVQDICNFFSRKHNKPDGYYISKETEEQNGTCDPHRIGSIASSHPGSTGSCYSDENLCCINNSCANWLSTPQGGRTSGSDLCAAQGKSGNYSGIPTGRPDENTCCGVVLHGYISRLFNSIKDFGDGLYNDGDRVIGNMRSRGNRISREYIKYFIYNNMLNMSEMMESAGVQEPLTYTDYDSIIEFIQDGIDVSYVGSKIIIKKVQEDQTLVYPEDAAGADETGSTLSEMLTHIVLNDTEFTNLLTDYSSTTSYGDLKTLLATTGEGESGSVSSEIRTAVSELGQSLHEELGPTMSLETVETRFGHFLNNYGSSRSILSGERGQDADSNIQSSNAKLEENMKLSLVLLDFRLPQQLGLRESSPLEQAFPEQTYNLATFSIYL